MGCKQGKASASAFRTKTMWQSSRTPAVTDDLTTSHLHDSEDLLPRLQAPCCRHATACSRIVIDGRNGIAKKLPAYRPELPLSEGLWTLSLNYF